MDDFDFGFTLVDEKDLDSVQQLSKVVEQSSSNYDSAQEKLDELYNAITPLLNNLKADPSREYIKWPDRVAKVEAFEEFISDIYSK